jgi:hypothetical protein
MKPARVLLIAAIAILIGSVIHSGYASISSQRSMGRVVGILLDPINARIKGATVTFKYGKSEWKAVSGEEGEFELALPAQQHPYSFTVRANGFCTFEGELVRVQANATEMINLYLEVGGTHVRCPCTSRRG